MNKLRFENFLILAVNAANSIAKGYSNEYTVAVKSLKENDSSSISERDIKALMDTSAGRLKSQKSIDKQNQEKQETLDSLALCVSWVTGGKEYGNYGGRDAESFVSNVAAGDLTFALFSFLALLDLADMSFGEYVLKIKVLETQSAFRTDHDCYGNYSDMQYKAINLKALYKALDFE